MPDTEVTSASTNFNATCALRFRHIGLWIERWRWALLGLVLLSMLLSRAAMASSIHLWYDENVDRDVALLPHLHDVWKFYADGTDTVGPSSALVLMLVRWLPVSPELWSRLPFLVCFLAMMASTFVFLNRRYPASYALCALAIVSTEPFISFSTEAKSYSTEWAALLLAMVCWQWRPSGEGGRLLRAAGVWFGLALAIFCHKFGIFYLVPFALAEVAAWWQQKSRAWHMDWPMVVAIVLSPLSIGITAKGDLRAARIYGGNFWSVPTLADLHDPFKFFFVVFWTFIDFAMLLAVAVAIVSNRRGAEPVELAEPSVEPSLEPLTKQGFSLPEWVLVSALGFMPLYAVPAATLLHAYRHVYVMAHVIGLAMLFIAVVAGAMRLRQSAGAVLFLGFVVLWLPGQAKLYSAGVRALAHPAAVHQKLAAAYDEQNWVRILRNSSLPVVAGDHSLYSTMHVYIDSTLDGRTIYLTDLSQAKKFPRVATSQINFRLFGPLLGYRTEDAQTFLREHNHFLLVVGEDPASWLPEELVKAAGEGRATLKLIGPGYDSPDVYEVWLPDADALAPTR